MPCIFKQQQAKQDLVDIWLYTYEQWGEKQADKYLDDLEGALHLIAEQPLICRERRELTPPVRIHNHAHHLIVYLIEDDRINLVRVLHESMDVNAQLSDA